MNEQKAQKIFYIPSHFPICLYKVKVKVQALRSFSKHCRVAFAMSELFPALPFDHRIKKKQRLTCFHLYVCLRALLGVISISLCRIYHLFLLSLKTTLSVVVDNLENVVLFIFLLLESRMYTLRYY